MYDLLVDSRRLRVKCSDIKMMCSSPVDIYLFRVNNRNTRTRCEIWRRSGVFFANFEHISDLVAVSLLLTLNI